MFRDKHLVSQVSLESKTATKLGALNSTSRTDFGNFIEHLREIFWNTELRIPFSATRSGGSGEEL